MKAANRRGRTRHLRQLFQRTPQPFMIFFAVDRAAEIAIQQMTHQPNFLTAVMALQAVASLVRLCAIISIKFSKMLLNFCCNWSYSRTITVTILLRLRLFPEP